MRHLLRIDGPVGVGLHMDVSSMTRVDTNEIIHLDESNPDEAKLAADLVAMPGWVELDDEGHAIDRLRSATATATVTPPDAEAPPDVDPETVPADPVESEPSAAS